jgi:hypothetical protein
MPVQMQLEVLHQIATVILNIGTMVLQLFVEPVHLLALNVQHQIQYAHLVYQPNISLLLIHALFVQILVMNVLEV